ncbi:MAG: SAP domain-containing protein, partial [Candidatus Thermoplasmatota archaeon]|nr:SAP domain-containing protein [Candidatus Thermoplasmatota archaeon]
MSDDFSSMTVAQLKELLKERDLPVSGNKKDLIARLEGAD